MNERPILFSGAMVRAILDGSKTQTRRIVKPQPVPYAEFNNSLAFVGPTICQPGYLAIGVDAVPGSIGLLKCPYGQPGDRLWGREAWRASSAHDDLAPSKIPVGDSVEYLADPERIVTGKGRPSIFLPRWASRITLEITGVRVERLQEITEEGAIAEGVELIADADPADMLRFRSYISDTPLRPLTAYESYRSLWAKINGPGSWDANPFVWVVEFTKIPQP